MGMYDDVIYECECPACEAKVTGFQSKDGDCELKQLQPSEVDNFYSNCPKCDCWIELTAIREPQTDFVLTVQDKAFGAVLDEHTKTVKI